MERGPGKDGHERNDQWLSIVLLCLYNLTMLAGGIILLPLLIPLLWAREKRRITIRQRLWWPIEDSPRRRGKRAQTLWVHALSVGEVLAARALVEQIRDRHQSTPIYFSASTHTGYQTACRIYNNSDVRVGFFPYDVMPSVRCAAARINPKAVILVETDIWPNFLAEMKRRNIPIFLVNMRLSDLTWERYRRFKWISRNVFGVFAKICVQTAADAQRMVKLGVASRRVCVTGNIKFDGGAEPRVDEAAHKWRKQIRIPDGSWVLVAGSTHEGEEALLIETFAALVNEGSAPRMIIAPRDPERAAHVLSLCRSRGLPCRGLSSVLANSGESIPDIVVVDFIGALKSLYCLADAAFIGGSLSRDGGHNPLEPAAYGKPVVFGPDMRDFRQIAAWLVEAGGAKQVADAAQLGTALHQLHGNQKLSEKMGHSAYAVFERHQGAVPRILEAIEL